MIGDETELEMVTRHVREGRRQVARQRELVEELRADGRRTVEAEQLLTTFEDLQRMHCEHLARFTGR